MARKYLNDIGIGDNILRIKPSDSRWETWREEIKTYGFASCETWCLDFVFYCWLYERLKMFLEVSCIDLNYHKFEFKGEEYTQGELINKMILGCELAFDDEYNNKKLNDEEQKVVEEVPWIWATVMPAMWW